MSNSASGHMVATSLIAGSLLASKLYLANIKHVPTGRKPTLWGPGRCARCTHVLTTSSEYWRRSIPEAYYAIPTSVAIFLVHRTQTAKAGPSNLLGLPESSYCAGPMKIIVRSWFGLAVF